MKKTFLLYGVISVIFLLFFSCKHQGPYPGEDICFETEIKPIFISNCTASGCHNAEDHEEGYDFTTYSGILKGLKKHDPEDSEIYEVITDNGDDQMPPSPWASLTEEQIQLIYDWIEAGAPLNEGCEMAVYCDTTNVTYSVTISSILNNYCIGCHNASVTSNNIKLDTYNDVKVYVDNGKLMGSILHQYPFLSMPPMSTMDSCGIKKIQNWIQQGAPNN
jgi:hypothetical protein